MKSRPWPLIILALIQILSPFGTIFFNAFAMGVKPAYVAGWMIHNRTPLQIFEAFALMPIAGMAIFRMKLWSYIVFFVAVFWSLASNLSRWNYATENHSPISFIVVYGLQIGLAIYFMIPSVRKTYLDPTVRWWEAKRRYLLNIPVTLLSVEGAADMTEEQGHLENISEGGALIIDDGHHFKHESKIRLKFTVATVDIEIPGEIVYCSKKKDSGASTYGVMFEHDRRTKSHLKRLCRGLDLIGVHHRDKDDIKTVHHGFLHWIIGLAKTGKGLVPDVKHRK
jgi:hypothetical protein